MLIHKSKGFLRGFGYQHCCVQRWPLNIICDTWSFLIPTSLISNSCPAGTYVTKLYYGWLNYRLYGHLPKSKFHYFMITDKFKLDNWLKPKFNTFPNNKLQWSRYNGIMVFVLIMVPNLNLICCFILLILFSQKSYFND